MVVLGNLLFGAGLLLFALGAWSLVRPIHQLRIKSRVAAAMVLCASLASCVVGVQLAPPAANETAKAAKVATAAPRAEPKLPTLDGIIVEGGAEEAKASGLRLCEGDYYGYACKKAYKVTLLGAPAMRATAHLKYPDALKLPVEKRTPADLRYEEVVFEFWPVETEYPCDREDPADPNVCAKDRNAGLPTLERKLLAEGWRYWSYRWGREYVKAGAPVTLMVGTNHLYANTVTLRRADPEQVAEELRRIAANEAETAKLAADRKAFMQQMAN